MAKPIRRKNRGPVILKILQGPSLHSIEHSLCSPCEDWVEKGVKFKVAVPFEGDHGGYFQMLVWVTLVPAELKRLDLDSCFAIGCFRTSDYCGGQIDLAKESPIQIANYSIKSREGYMEISNSTYCSFVDPAAYGVCRVDEALATTRLELTQLRKFFD